ncbi:MAG TPA: Rieske (2Fe-2S) protein [Ilumatobacter sp.]|nr:Rieske (2Fe-2S) protein [Ilumatobacter sp.]
MADTATTDTEVVESVVTTARSPLTPVAGATDDFEALARRVDEARAELARLDPGDRALADEAIAAVETFHKPALVAFVRRLRDDPRGKELLFELVDDPHVRAVLALHGVIKAPPVPATEPAPSQAATTFIPISEIKVRHRPSNGWHRGPALGDVPPGTLAGVELTSAVAGTLSVVFVNSAGAMTAFRNECAHQGMPLDRATIDAGTLTCPWHGFRFDATTGECLSAPGAQLETFPVKAEDDYVWVRIP